MAARGDVGVTIDTSKVPVRETGMTPYEILLSRVAGAHARRRASPAARTQVKAILEKWDLTAEVIGEVIAEPVYRVTEGDHVVAEFPGSRLVTDCPRLHPDAREGEAVKALRARDPHAVPPRAEESRSRSGRSLELLVQPDDRQQDLGATASTTPRCAPAR